MLIGDENSNSHGGNELNQRTHISCYAMYEIGCVILNVVF